MVVAEVVKRAMLAGLGAQEKAKEFVDELVKAGELSKSEAATTIKEWTSKAEQGTKDMDVKFKDAVTGVLEKLNIPTRDDIEKLEKKVQSLSARLRKLEGGGEPEA
ncbi:MAG: phasin family protein [Nitrospiraceae bacterium]|nr:phasin family protein [Nitrospiraceae bacterium]